MEVIDRLSAPDQGAEAATIYTVALDDGSTVDVKRKHFTSLVYIMEPHPEGINTQAVIRIVREAYPDDFITPVFERRLIYSYAPVQAICHSMEQAVWMAEREWKREEKRDSYTMFRIRNGKEVLRDFLEK